MIFFNKRIIFNTFKYKRRISHGACTVDIRWTSTGLKLLFFGTDSFSLSSLKKLNDERKHNSNIQTLEVVTSLKSPKNPVRSYGEQNDLKLHRWPLETIAGNSFDLGIVVSFGHLIPERIISLFPLGMINVHASLLPRWRGAAPIIYAIKNGDRKTGVTIMKIEPKQFDIGNILAQKQVEISEDMHLPELHIKMAEEGAELLLSSVLRFPEILSEATPQDSSRVSYAPKITAEFCDVDWNRMTAQEVHNLYRALYSYKFLTTKWQTKVLKFIEIRKSSHVNRSCRPGYVEYCKTGKFLRVFCKDGSSVEVSKVSIERRKTITASDFNNGFLKGYPIEKRYFRHEIVDFGDTNLSRKCVNR